MSKFDNYNDKYLYNNIKITNNNIYNKIYDKDYYFGAKNFKDLFTPRKNDINPEPRLTWLFEQLMDQYKISLPTLRNLLTPTNISKLGLNIKEVKEALDYIELKRQNRSTSSINQQPSNPSPSVIPQGSSYNANNMWSPVSLAGTVYEWNRGVIGISYEGEVSKEKLDGTANHHADATVRVARSLGANLEMTLMPFQAGINANEQGILILQLEGDKCFVYFPQNITQAQQRELIQAITPRSSFEFSFIHGDQMFDGKTNQDVISYANILINRVPQETSPRMAR